MSKGVITTTPKFVLETAPSSSPITVAEAKIYLRVPSSVTTGDTLIQVLIDTAVAHVEAFTNRKLMQQAWSIYFDTFPPWRRMEIPLIPASAFTVIEYLNNADGNWTTLDSSIYTSDFYSIVPAVTLNALVPMWPLTKYLAINSVHVKATCGYANAAAVPPALKSAMYRMISTWYDNRADAVQGQQVFTVPVTAELLMYPYKVYFG